MSHFSVLVITDEFPSQKLLEKTLMPWHEFECTGLDNEYVQEFDITDEVRKDYESDTITQLKDQNGNLHDPHEDRFYRDPTVEEKKKIGIGGTGCNSDFSYRSKDWNDGLGYRPKVKFVPDGWEKVEVPRNQVQTFLDYVKSYYGSEVLTGKKTKKHKYGWVEVDDQDQVLRMIDRTNPNKEWDWWVVGGRWSGMLTSRYERGLDQVQKKHLDLEEMIRERQKEREDEIAKACERHKMTTEELEQAIQQEHEANQKWQQLPEPRPRGAEYKEWVKNQGYELGAQLQTFLYPEVPVGTTLMEWVASAPPIQTYVVVKDGQWISKGTMGWFGCSTNEKEDWPQQFKKLLELVRDDQWLTVVDCHI